MGVDVSSSNTIEVVKNMGCFDVVATVAQAMLCQAMVVQALTLH